MKNNYIEFELEVRALSNPLDFEENKDKLKELRITSYDTFLNLLKIGSEITPAIYVCEEIFKICKTTTLGELDVVKLMMKSRSLNSIMDEQKFKGNNNPTE